MNEGQIIRKEAKDFFDWKINGSSNAQAIDDFHEIKNRLSDFNSSESQSIFLNEIEFLIKDSLQKHRDKSHGGQPSPTCGQEISTEKLLFYIKQEIDTLQKFESILSMKEPKQHITNQHITITKSKVGEINQSSDNIVKSPNEKPKTWSISNFTFVIITGVIIGILVLIFWEQIKHFFENIPTT